MSLFQPSTITSSDLGGKTSFEVACGIPAKSSADKLATHVYACSYGINELLTSSFKLRDPDKPFVVDPWEAIMVELTFLFGAPMIVVKAKRGEGGKGYFTRTNVTDDECLFIRGEKRGLPSAETRAEALLPDNVRRELDQFYELHASSKGHPGQNPPLAMYCQKGEVFDKLFEGAGLEYGRLLSVLGEQGHGDAEYLDAKIKNPELLTIREVAVLALYHVHPHRKNVTEFVGTVEIYLPGSLPRHLSWVDADLIGSLALTLSVSVNKLRPDDFRSYFESPTIPVEDLPSFREYGKDLDRFLDLLVDQSGEAGAMVTDSSLPDVFDDLYLQIRRLLELYVDQPESISIAFVVPEIPDTRGHSVARYYFPPQFVREVFGTAADPIQIRSALDTLKVSNKDQQIGLPLNLGVLGYLRQTAFPAVIMHELAGDARTLSYDNKLQKQEFALFFRGQDRGPLRVIEFPLVLFADPHSKSAYPSALIIFMTGLDEELPFRTYHHLYALACDARYTLSKAFAAEVYREDQVNKLSTVVHDVDRMCRPFALGIKEMSASVSGPSSDAAGQESLNSLKTLGTTAQVIQDVLQFAQWLANRREVEEPKEEEWWPRTLSSSLADFQEMFSLIWQSGMTWPGWEKLSVTWDRVRTYKIDQEPTFRWPQGALYTILWNLSANAEKKYRDLKAGTGSRTPASISCHINKPDPVALEGAGGTRLVALARFELSFPGIDFWDPNLLGTEASESEYCTREARISCGVTSADEEECDVINECGSYLHAKIFTSANSSSGRQGLRSCRQALDEWYRLMNLKDRSPIEPFKAGRPVKVRFSVPLIRGA